MSPPLAGRLLLALAGGLLAACTTTPGATELPPESVEAAPAVAAVAAPDPATGEVPVEPLELEGVRGGRATFLLPGDPEQVSGMLLDFDAMTGKRTWAKSYRLVRREPGMVVAHWSFKGRAGINPEVDLVFEVAPWSTDVRPAADADGAIIRYRLLEGVFGLAAFFGSYRIAPAPAKPGHSIVEETVYIDSGVWIANASAEDIEDGLQEDARRLDAWLRERLSLPPHEPPGPGDP